MTVYHAFDKDGAFIAGDTETGLTAYAYPTSTHANRAHRTPEKIAEHMVKAERWRVPTRSVPQWELDYDTLNWCRLAALCL